MSAKLYKQLFTSNGIWTAPAGINFVIMTGCGGGGGGGSGGITLSGSFNTTPGGGGQPAPTCTQIIPVIPGTTYAITIGAGGAGGALTTPPSGSFETALGNRGSDGYATTFGGISFQGGSGGIGGGVFPVPSSGGTADNENATIFLASVLPMLATFATTSGSGANGGVSNNYLSVGGNQNLHTAGQYGGGGSGGNAGTGASFGFAGGNGFLEISWIV